MAKKASQDPMKATVEVDGQQVRLGRRPPRPGKQSLRFSYFVDPMMATIEPPESVDWTPKAMESINRMFKNDTYGDCVIAEKYHKCGVLSANDGPVCRVGPDDEVVSQYHRICGAGDNGCVITDVLDEIVAGRFKVGGEVFQLDGYAAVDNSNVKLAKTAIYLFGTLTLGLDLPSAWTGSSEIWDVTNTRSVGGHDVGVAGYDAKYLYILSWAKIYKMTWAAFTSNKWVGEAWVSLGPDWYGADKQAPAAAMGLMVDELKKDMDLIKQGRIPEIPPAAIHRFEDLV